MPVVTALYGLNTSQRRWSKQTAILFTVRILLRKGDSQPHYQNFDTDSTTYMSHTNIRFCLKPTLPDL